MLLILGECLGHSTAAVRRYREKFTHRSLHLKTLSAVERSRETGMIFRSLLGQ